MNGSGENPPAGAERRNSYLRGLHEERHRKWKIHFDNASKEDQIQATVVAAEMSKLIESHDLRKKFVYAHEAVSDPQPFHYFLPFSEDFAEPSSYYCVGGGSLGWSMPASLGIKLTSRGHQGIVPELVVNAVGDGSSLFYPQVWWTAVKKKLPILYIVMNNRRYRTLQVGLEQVEKAFGDKEGYRWETAEGSTQDYLTIEEPRMDFVKLAQAFGDVAGCAVKKPTEVRDALEQGFAHVLDGKGPFLIDVETVPPEHPLPQTVQAEILRQPPIDVYFHGTECDAKSFKPVIF